MYKRFGLRIVSVAMACLALQVPTMAQTKSAFELAPSQILKPADLTPDELAYYNGATDPVIKKNFIITRSYVRLAEKIVAKEIPAWQFPGRKPDGFSAKFLLPKDPSVINEALGICLQAKFTACLENPNSLLCQRWSRPQ
jgi:hypothetical protein